MTKARTLADFISDGSPLADGTISVSEVSGAAPLANPTFTGTASGTFSGPLTGDVAGELDLSPIASTIADTAVDVFVYDTSKDSDGGAWRKRTQGTSWYNETLNTATRGSRKEFPAVAVIVAESTQLTIYDGDDPDLPMWMVFDKNNSGPSNVGNMLHLYGTNAERPFKAVVARDGHFAVCEGGSAGVLYDLNFIADNCNWITENVKYGGLYRGSISERNDGNGATYFNANVTLPVLVAKVCNDVAMTVLPNAPIDAATGLPVPTIAVATSGGVSVIKDDGSVYDSNTTKVIDWLTIQDGTLFHEVGDTENFSEQVELSSISADGWSGVRFAQGSTTPIGVRSSSSHAMAMASTKVAVGSEIPGEEGLGVYDNPNKISVVSGGDDDSGYKQAYITSTYNTGWMNGDIKLATLSDTDDTDVTGSELVTNGTFDSDVSGWSAYNAVISHDSGTIKVDDTANAGGNSNAYQQVTLEVGKTYTISVDVTATTDVAYIAISTNYTNPSWYASAVGVGTYSHTFVAGSATQYIALCANGTSVTNFDNVSLRLAEEDRSVNGNGLQVFGSITKNPVATGADLVAYSGFSNVNYLYQPYNSDLDFGTGDFCIMGWANHANAAASQEMVSRGTSSGTSFRFMYRPNNPDMKFQIDSTSNVFTETEMGGISLSSLIGTWAHFVALRRNGVIEIYINGDFKASEANTANVDISTSDHLVLGNNKTPSNSLDVHGSMALWRISATAPSPEQIAKVYEDEKVLFTEGSQATLYGSSDAVTALAYDDITELLHVGTSAGRSDFQGLRRVNNTTNAVGAAISASNGMIVEE